MSDCNYVGGNNYGNVGGHDNVAMNKMDNDIGQFMMALAKLRQLAEVLPVEERQEIIECVDAITDEVQKPEPKKTVVRRLLDGIGKVASNERVQEFALKAGEIWLKSQMGG